MTIPHVLLALQVKYALKEQIYHLIVHQDKIVEPLLGMLVLAQVDIIQMVVYAQHVQQVSTVLQPHHMV